MTSISFLLEDKEEANLEDIQASVVTFSLFNSPQVKVIYGSQDLQQNL